MRNVGTQSMQQDIRQTPLYAEAGALYQDLRQPGSGQISDAAESHVSADGKRVVFSGVLVDRLEGTLPTRICEVQLETGDMRGLSFGPSTDRLPKYSPDGPRIAFLSDRGRIDDFQLYLMDSISGAARSTPPVEGWVEYLHWSPDGRRILLGVAGHGADIAGGQGAITSRQVSQDTLSWMPSVESGDETYRWRQCWVYELDADRVRQVGPTDSNVWEAVWCGNDTIAAVASPGPGEGLWYSARMQIIEIASGEARLLYTPEDQ